MGEYVVCDGYKLVETRLISENPDWLLFNILVYELLNTMKQQLFLNRAPIMKPFSTIRK